jgi:hypothetical protein
VEESFPVWSGILIVTIPGCGQASKQELLAYLFNILVRPSKSNFVKLLLQSQSLKHQKVFLISFEFKLES